MKLCNIEDDLMRVRGILDVIDIALSNTKIFQNTGSVTIVLGEAIDILDKSIADLREYREKAKNNEEQEEEKTLK